MVRTTETLHQSLDALAKREKAFAKVLKDHGRPEPRVSEPGVETLLRTIVGQQVSVAAARSMWNKLTAKFGQPVNLETLLAASDEEMREAGMSRQKAGYLRSLAGLVLAGELDLAHLPEDDEEAIAQLIKIKGIGRWSAEIYLLFAEGRHGWKAGTHSASRFPSRSTFCSNGPRTRLLVDGNKGEHAFSHLDPDRAAVAPGHDLDPDLH